MQYIVKVALLAVLLCGGCCSAQCSDGYVDIDGSCLGFVVAQLVNWTEATTICQQFGGQLAKVESAGTLRGIFEYIETYALSGDFWLGGSDQNNEGDWLWVDGSRVIRGTPFWSIEEGFFGWSQAPDGGDEEDCLVLQEDKFFYWDDVSCGRQAHPVCQAS